MSNQSEIVKIFNLPNSEIDKIIDDNPKYYMNYKFQPKDNINKRLFVISLEIVQDKSKFIDGELKDFLKFLYGRYRDIDLDNILDSIKILASKALFFNDPTIESMLKNFMTDCLFNVKFEFNVDDLLNLSIKQIEMLENFYLSINSFKIEDNYLKRIVTLCAVIMFNNKFKYNGYNDDWYPSVIYNLLVSNKEITKENLFPTLMPLMAYKKSYVMEKFSEMFLSNISNDKNENGEIIDPISLQVIKGKGFLLNNLYYSAITIFELFINGLYDYDQFTRQKIPDTKIYEMSKFLCSVIDPYHKYEHLLYGDKSINNLFNNIKIDIYFSDNYGIFMIQCGFLIEFLSTLKDKSFVESLKKFAELKYQQIGTIFKNSVNGRMN